MGYIRGEGRSQGTLFPVTLDELVPADHIARVIERFVDRMDLVQLDFRRARPEETGRPGYDPRDLLKLYIYGYLFQVRTSRRLEAECRRNVEMMWLLGRLVPDHKAISEFRRLHAGAVVAAAVGLVRFARDLGLVRGEWVVIDGSKFRAVSSADGVREREQAQAYLDSLDACDQLETFQIDASATQAALAALEGHLEPEAHFMRSRDGSGPAYNVQTAVDAEHGLIVAQDVVLDRNDKKSLQPMAQAAAQVLEKTSGQAIHVVVDAGYSNGAQAAACEAQNLIPHGPVQRTGNRYGAGRFFDASKFVHDPASDTMRCPAGVSMRRLHEIPIKNGITYGATRADCRDCVLRSQCTDAKRRTVFRNLHDAALKRMHQRATPPIMRLRGSTVELPFAVLKYRIFGHPRFVLRGRIGALTEITLGAMAYNLKRMLKVMGFESMERAMRPA